MSLRNLCLAPFRRPAPPAEPAWDAKGHTVLCAFARLRELESEPRKHGGKAASKQIRDRLEARQRAWKLFDEWFEDRRHDGRSGGSETMTESHVARDSAGNKPEQQSNMRKS